MDNWQRRENYLFSLYSPFCSIEPDPRCDIEIQSVWIKCCRTPRSHCRSKFVWKVNSAVGTKWSFAVLGKKLKNRVGKIFADMPLDWITFWQKHILALCLQSGFCLRAGYYYLFFLGMSEHSFKLGLNIITIYSFHISKTFFFFCCILGCILNCKALWEDPFWKLWVYCSS